MGKIEWVASIPLQIVVLYGLNKKPEEQCRTVKEAITGLIQSWYGVLTAKVNYHQVCNHLKITMFCSSRGAPL